MKIVLVGPGILPIPPKGWGAIEILIADQAEMLRRYGFEVEIINEAIKHICIAKINSLKADAVHFHYDEHIDWIKEITCPQIYITSHFGYLSSYKRNSIFLKNDFIYKLIRIIIKITPQKLCRLFGFNTKHRNLIEYYSIFKKFLTTKAQIICLSKEIDHTYKEFNSQANRTIFHNGARADLIRFSEKAKYEQKAICIGKIEERKKQAYLQDILEIQFVGPIVDKRFNKNNKNYLGIWTRKELFANLTNYSTLVLISNGEAHPLVCCEALMAGLGLVISEEASANIDRSLPFINIIDKRNINQKDYIFDIIRQNIQISKIHRKEIRQYALSHFNIEKLMTQYPPIKNHNLKIANKF